MTVAQLEYDLALRLLDHQQAVLRDLRDRTSTLLAASAIVSSFLGGTAIDRSGLTLTGAAALMAFLALVVTTLGVLVPDARMALVAIPGATRDVDVAFRRVARVIRAARSRNEPRLRKLERRYKFAAFALVLEVSLWALDLGAIL